MPTVEALQTKFAKEDNEAIDSAVSVLLAAPNGRKYLWWLLGIGKIGMQPFARNAMDTAFSCGELNVGQRILDHIMSVDPAGYVAMMKEQADDRKYRDTAIGNAAAGRSDPDVAEPEPESYL